MDEKSDEGKRIQSLVNHVKTGLTAQRYTSQVVAGMNYDIQCVDSKNNKFYVAVFQALPSDGSKISGKAYTEAEFKKMPADSSMQKAFGNKSADSDDSQDSEQMLGATYVGATL